MREIEMEIPNQLKKNNIKFCRIKRGTKKPFEENWPRKPYTYEEISKYLDGENYGVLCGYGDLIVIDSDDDRLQKIINEKLPNTFKVKTGRGGTHNYYLVKNIDKKIVLELNKEHLGEIQFMGQQVIGPNSTHPNGNIYTPLNNNDIVEIEKEVLFDVIKQFIREIEVSSENREFEVESGIDTSNIDILSLFDITKFKKMGEQYYGSHPLHGSETGMNFWINPSKGIWHCFRHNTGGGILSAIGMMNGIIDCSECIKGGFRGEKFIETLKVAREKYNLKKTIIDELIELENIINNEGERKLRRDIDLLLKRILKVKSWVMQQYFISLLAYRTKINKNVLSKRLREIKNTQDNINEEIDVEDLLKRDIKDIEYWIEPLLPKDSITVIGGKPESYKSMFVLKMLLSLELVGDKFMDTFKINHKNPKILYYDLENNMNMQLRRITYLLNGTNNKKEELKNIKFKFCFDIENLENELEYCKNFDIIVFDSYRRFLKGNENDSVVVSDFYKTLFQPLRNSNKNIIIIHHLKKGEIKNLESQELSEMYRGSGDIIANPDVLLTLIKDEEVYNGNLTSFNVAVLKSKVRDAYTVKPFMFRVDRNDLLKTTQHTFLGYKKKIKPKDKVIDKLTGIINKRGEIKREEVVELLCDEFEIKPETVDKYLTELLSSGVLYQPKYGYYSLAGDKQKTFKID